MCSIFFAVGKRGLPLKASVAEAANAAMRHRGPDESGCHVHENVVLGYNRLSIVDIAGGQQPFVSGPLVWVCNGEIYNYRALREELVRKGRTFRSQSDCEIIGHLYDDNPDGFVERLDGMFAFVLLDTRRRRLLFARDRLGMKPIVIHDGADYLIGSSEIKGLLATGLVPPALNRQAVADSFVFGYVPGEETVFEGVRWLPPAKLGGYDLRSGSRLDRSYWRPSFETASGSLTIHEREIRDRLRAAVASHTIGDEPVACYLSGGVDSSVITSLLAEVQDGVKSFSISVPSSSFDETPLIRKTAEELHLQARFISVESVGGAAMVQVARMLEQPQFAPIDVAMQRLSHFVRQSGVKVVLAGEGSDELYGGYGSYTLNQINRALAMPGIPSLHEGLLKRVLPYYFSSRTTQAKFLHVYTRLEPAVRDRFGTFPAWYPFWWINQEVRSDFLDFPAHDSLGPDSAMAAAARPILNGLDGIADFDKSIYLELKTRLPNYILHRSDRNAMSNSVEARLPFLDNRMIDYSLAVPPLLKMYGLREKHIIRRAFKDIAPRHVLKTRKLGFNVPNSWIWQQPDDCALDMLSRDSLRRVGLFKPDAVAKMLKDAATTLAAGNLADFETTGAMLTGILTTQILHYEFVERPSWRQR
jgi:asparagine synthase (glutamine-hydrolysing)